jgi:multiple sugar transport system substrate-binding protein
MSGRAFALAAAASILVMACSTTGPSAGGGGSDQGKPFVFASTQFTPVLEQENMRKKILTAYQGASVDFVTDQGPVILDRISAEAKAGAQGQIGLVGAENGELSALAASGAFEDLTKFADGQKEMKIPQDMMTLGKYGGSAQLYIPWMQATYFLVANKKALPYLPSGADVNALTYKQLIEWAKNISDKTGQRRYGFTLGGGSSPGLIHRLIQGYFYPSYTGGLVTTFKSPEAVTMWNDLKEL